MSIFAKDDVSASSGTASKVEVDFASMTGADVIGDKIYEFVKTGRTAASGNTAVVVAEDTDAAALASVFKALWMALSPPLLLQVPMAPSSLWPTPPLVPPS